ncbi:MAG: hypothetical protein ACJA1P_002189, partial [Maribacter sp.]
MNKILKIATIILVLFASVVLNAKITKEEKQILKEFYEATNGSEWTHTWDFNKK